MNSNKRKEKEYKPAKKFISFYSKEHNVKNVRLIRQKSNSKSKSPDYYLPRLNSYLEVKELRDRADIERSAQFWRIITNFKKYIECNPLYKNVNGVYVLDAPSQFKYPSDEKNLKERMGLFFFANPSRHSPIFPLAISLNTLW